MLTNLDALNSGFTTLSVSLGRMILSVHEGLHAALGQETRTSVISACLKALAVLVASVHYERLPADLPNQVVKVSYFCLLFVFCSSGCLLCFHWGVSRTHQSWWEY